MPFPFTLDGNTYTASDFSTKGYDEKIVDILTDLNTTLSSISHDLPLLSFNFALSSWTVDIGVNNWAIPGEIVMIHSLSGVDPFVFARVDSVSGSSLTLSASANHYRAGNTTVTGVRVIKDSVENPRSFSFEDHDALISSESWGEDFITTQARFFQGDYVPGGSVSDSLTTISLRDQVAKVDAFVVGENSYIVSGSIYGVNYPGRGWASLGNRTSSEYVGLYFNSKTNCSRYQTCFLLEAQNTPCSEIIIGLQGYPSSGTPAAPIGYPHELVTTGKAAYGPALVFDRSGDVLTVTPFYGVTAGTVYTLPEEVTYLPLSVEIRKVSGVFTFRVGTPTQFAILQGNFPSSAGHLATANRPYLSVNSGEMLVDYIWVST